MSSATFSRPSRGDVLELTIDSLAHGGNGVARREGYVVFVAGGVPGDRVRAEVGKAKKAYAEARAIEIVEPSPDRVPEVADHPGAPWQVIPYERQLAVKAEQVEDALRRIGKLDGGFTLEPIVPAGQEWRYRNKLEYSFGTGPEGELVCGFHAPGRWNDILPMTDCKLASERSNELREQVLAFCREQGLGAWDRRDHTRLPAQPRHPRGPPHRPDPGAADHLARQARHRTPSSPRSTPTACGGRRPPTSARAPTAASPSLLSGAPQLTERLNDLDFLISPEAFFQTNTEMAEKLYGVALEYAGLGGVEQVFDLYSGIGTIALSLATRARRVIGLEIIESAVADAIENARVNEMVNASFYAGDARLALRELVEREGRPDLAIIDPPRAGLSQKVVRRIVDAAPSRIVYVSCNPTTLAPNAAQLVEAGYELKKVRPVDMFPQTPHIECVALLEAGPDGVKNPDRD